MVYCWVTSGFTQSVSTLTAWERNSTISYLSLESPQAALKDMKENLATLQSAGADHIRFRPELKEALLCFHVVQSEAESCYFLCATYLARPLWMRWNLQSVVQSSLSGFPSRNRLAEVAGTDSWSLKQKSRKLKLPKKTKRPIRSCSWVFDCMEDLTSMFASVRFKVDCWRWFREHFMSKHWAFDHFTWSMSEIQRPYWLSWGLKLILKAV